MAQTPLKVILWFVGELCDCIMYYMTRKLPTRICFQIWLLSIWYYVGWEWRKTKTQTNKCVQKNNSSFSPTKAVLESFSPSIIYLSEGLKDMWKWEVPIKVWDRSQRQKMGFCEWSQNQKYAVMGLNPQNTGIDPRTSFFDSGINPRSSNFFLWDLMANKLSYFWLG